MNVLHDLSIAWGSARAPLGARPPPVTGALDSIGGPDPVTEGTPGAHVFLPWIPGSQQLNLLGLRPALGTIAKGGSFLVVATKQTEAGMKLCHASAGRHSERWSSPSRTAVMEHPSGCCVPRSRALRTRHYQAKHHICVSKYSGIPTKAHPTASHHGSSCPWWSPSLAHCSLAASAVES